MSVFLNWTQPGREIVTAELKWNIKALPFLETQTGDGKTLVSSFFSAEETPGRQWRMQVHDGHLNLITIYVYHYKKNTEPLQLTAIGDDTVLVEFAIIDSQGVKVHQKMKSSYSSQTYVEFTFNKPEVLKSAYADGSFNFYCAIRNFVKQEDILRKTTKCVTKQQINCTDQLVTHLEELFHSMKHSDVTFNILGRKFKVHKSILTSRSQVFAAMFEHPTKEKLSNQVKIEDIEPGTFNELLLFIYTGRIPKMETMPIKLFVAADKYMIDGLKTACENHLIRNMSPGNCLELLSLTSKHPAEHLKKNAITFFRHHTVEVMATDEWAKIKQENLPWICETMEILLKQADDAKASLIIPEISPSKRSRLR